MKKVTLESLMNVSSGLIGLTDKQAATRAHCLELTDDDGIYEVVLPIQLKVGEEILLPGDTPKASKKKAVAKKKATSKKKVAAKK